jgi:hypothetical protein
MSQSAITGLDLLSPLLIGGYWSAKVLLHVPDDLVWRLDESNAYIGLVAFAMLIVAGINRRRFLNEDIGLWFTALGVFFLLSLGSTLHIGGEVINGLPMPYLFLQKLPGFNLSLNADRMGLMISFETAVISAFGFKVIIGLLAQAKVALRVGVVMLFAVMMAVEYLPVAPSLSALDLPQYELLLKTLPGQDGVIDTINIPSLSMYYQTYHAKPILFAYTTRVTQRVGILIDQVQTLIDTQAYDQLYSKYDLRYLIIPTSTTVPAKVLYRDKTVTLYDLAYHANIVSEF